MNYGMKNYIHMYLNNLYLILHCWNEIFSLFHIIVGNFNIFYFLGIQKHYTLFLTGQVIYDAVKLGNHCMSNDITKSLIDGLMSLGDQDDVSMTFTFMIFTFLAQIWSTLYWMTQRCVKQMYVCCRHRLVDFFILTFYAWINLCNFNEFRRCVFLVKTFS